MADPDYKKAADKLAAMVKSFIKSAPFVAPENMEFMVEEKLNRPLSEYEAAVADCPE
jgi:hypothetical protein